MRRALIGAAAAAALAGGLAHAAPLEAYGKLPTMDQVSISPDGTKVAFAQQVGGKYTIVVDQLNPAAIVAELPPSAQKVRALIWADPTHLLVVKSQTGYAPGIQSGLTEWSTVQSFDVAKRKAMPLFGKAQDFGNRQTAGLETMNTISALPEVRTVKGHTTVFAHGEVFVDRQGVPALISADLDSGNEVVVEHATAGGEGRAWILDEHGVPLVQTSYDQVTHNWTLRLRQGGTWIDAYSAKALNDPPGVLGLSPDGSSLLLDMLTGEGAPEIRPMSLADHKLGAPVNEYGGYADLLHDPVTHRVFGGVKMGMEPTYVFFDPKDQAAWDLVAKSFPDEQVDPVSWSSDRGKVVVRVTGVRHGIVYEVVDVASRKGMQIGPAYDGIKPADLADVAIAAYRAKADGLAINAFLTLPTGREPKNLPLIVLAHGGPAARDEAGFNWWAQALASRGYAVLQPQFRGSAGFGWKLEAAGFGEFGRKMQSDLSDGVRALVAQGYIDPKRVCIVGASYGGYAALAGVTMEQGVYRCAVAVAGVSDMRAQIGGRTGGGGAAVDPARSIVARFWDRFAGAKDPSDPVYDRISPFYHAAQASAPILLIHGKDDTVVPFDQSQKMEAALKAANKPVEFVVLPNEDHWLSREATRQQMLQATVTFLEKNNPPQ
jgi:dipeptidyl aminopeptidase/acylaminoacyl peptidase